MNNKIISLILTVTALIGLDVSNHIYAQSQDWTVQESGTTIRLNDVFFIDENIGWIVGDSSLILHTTNGGEEWIEQNSPVDSITFSKVLFPTSQDGYIVGWEGTILYTHNSGSTWAKSDIGLNFPIFDLSFINAETGWAVGGDIFGESMRGIILNTKDGGVNWDIQFETNPSNFYQSMFFAAIEFSDSLNGWALAGDYHDNFASTFLFRTTNGGIDWDTTGTEIYTPLWEISVHNDTIWGSGFHFASSTNGGKSWTFYTWRAQYNFFSFQDAKLINRCEGWVLGNVLGSGSLILSTEDCGATWEVKLSQQNPTVQSLYILNNNSAWAVGVSGLIISYRNTVGIKDRNGETAQNFRLNQNYPNPFNPETSIGFTLPEAGKVRLTIYDLGGREIAKLINGEMSAGFHNVTWDASRFASGVYIYRLTSRQTDGGQAGNFVATKKMVLLK